MKNGESIEAHTTPRGILPARLEAILGFLPKEMQNSLDTPATHRSLFLGPDLEVLKVTKESVVLAPNGCDDRRRRRELPLRKLQAILFIAGNASEANCAALARSGVATVQYTLRAPIRYLESTPEVEHAMVEARRNPLWLFAFNLALGLSQLVRTVEAAMACKSAWNEIENLVFSQLDVMIDGLGHKSGAKRVTRNRYLQCEGRMSSIREAYVREKLRKALGVGVVGTVGRSAGRKVEVEAGEPRSFAQSCFDATKNWMHLGLRMALRIGTANEGFGWNAPWLFNHRLAGLGLHLDLEEVPKMACDAPLAKWFLSELLRERDFVVGRDRYLMPTYRPTPERERWLRSQAETLVRSVPVWYGDAYIPLNAAHQHHIASLHEALLAQNSERYLPLMYLPQNRPELAGELFRVVAEELRCRLTAGASLQPTVDRILDLWNGWLTR